MKKIIIGAGAVAVSVVTIMKVRELIKSRTTDEEVDIPRN